MDEDVLDRLIDRFVELDEHHTGSLVLGVEVPNAEQVAEMQRMTSGTGMTLQQAWAKHLSGDYKLQTDLVLHKVDDTAHADETKVEGADDIHELKDPTPNGRVGVPACNGSGLLSDNENSTAVVEKEGISQATRMSLTTSSGAAPDASLDESSVAAPELLPRSDRASKNLDFADLSSFKSISFEQLPSMPSFGFGHGTVGTQI